MRCVIRTTFLMIISLILTGCSTGSRSMHELTPTEDPFSYQNPFYPLSVGNYWKMGHYKELNDGELSLVGYYLINVLDYTYQEVYFGSKLEYIPVYRIEKQYVQLDSSEITTTYQFAVKMKQGVIISNTEPKDNKIDPFLFIPSSRTNDEISEKLTNKTVSREVKVKTPFFEMKCLRIEIMEDNIGGSILFARNKGHVVSLLYDNYPQNTTRMDNQIIINEYRLE